VDSIQPGRFFTWVAGAPGFRNVATHSVEPTGTGSRATLSIDQFGVVGELFARLTADLTRRYLDMEAAGLKRRSEEQPPESAT
jgi:hypothetical protein